MSDPLVIKIASYNLKSEDLKLDDNYAPTEAPQPLKNSLSEEWERLGRIKGGMEVIESLMPYVPKSILSNAWESFYEKYKHPLI